MVRDSGVVESFESFQSRLRKMQSRGGNTLFADQGGNLAAFFE
jgi:hypothetical protein